jgi:hypothetical protein
MSIYKTAHYFTNWRFPSSLERVAAVVPLAEIGKVAWQQDNNSFWVATAAGWALLSPGNQDPYTPTDTVTSVAGKVGVVTLDKGDVGLGNVDNTSDAAKDAAVATLVNKTLDLLRTTAHTVATLPAAATAGAGARSFVSDSTVTLSAGLGAVVAGTGANKVPVYSDAIDWRIG